MVTASISIPEQRILLFVLFIYLDIYIFQLRWLITLISHPFIYDYCDVVQFYLLQCLFHIKEYIIIWNVLNKSHSYIITRLLPHFLDKGEFMLSSINNIMPQVIRLGRWDNYLGLVQRDLNYYYIKWSLHNQTNCLVQL